MECTVGGPSNYHYHVEVYLRCRIPHKEDGIIPMLAIVNFRPRLEQVTFPEWTPEN